MQWLEVALDYGISEFEFWNMTIAELVRAIESKKRIEKRQQQEKASFDYILADLIGRSISRIYSSAATMPDINTVYPSLFESEEIIEQKKAKQAELSAIRFRQFAHSYNSKLKRGDK